MSTESQDLINGYLDDTLTVSEQNALATWLSQSPEHAHRFAEDVLLHDHLRTACAGGSVRQPCPANADAALPLAPRRPLLTAVAAGLLATAAALLIAITATESRPASAALVQLNRLIAVQTALPGRSYQIHVESQHQPARQRYFSSADSADHPRPPKPPLDNALLTVSGTRFVLTRITADGGPFITGSDGLTSWVIPPTGPVRVSTDTGRFNHDLPGHEYAIPLATLADGLGQLREAYDLELQRQPAQASSPQHQQLIATKRRGARGPQRVEIMFDAATDAIGWIRFVDMPYGPDRLTLQLVTATDSRPPPDGFFQHHAHHAADRHVIEE
jgi:hypothetical protein